MASPSEHMAKPSQDSVIYMDELRSGRSRSASPSMRLSSRPSSPVVDESQSHPQLHPHVSERSLVPYDTHHLQAELLHNRIARRRNSEYDEDLTHDAELVDPEYIFDENGDGKRDDGSHRNNNNRPAGGVDDGLFDDNDDEERRLVTWAVVSPVTSGQRLPHGVPGVRGWHDGAHPRHERLPAEEDHSPGHDGSGAHLGQRQSVPLRAAVERPAPLLLPLAHHDRPESLSAGGRRHRPHLEQPLQRQGRRADVQGQSRQQLDGHLHLPRDDTQRLHLVLRGRRQCPRGRAGQRQSGPRHLTKIPRGTPGHLQRYDKSSR
ncbi:unnamed protein product [Trichogramma brassicae]|uniref:Uncharacterized protein n=1 Tax=Trichogramma brassicae TaxID=86971 RepID=A0A6H5I9X9_9HYME|nr:unnamed protein product [Trichogramma brassicae]